MISGKSTRRIHVYFFFFYVFLISRGPSTHIVWLKFANKLELGHSEYNETHSLEGWAFGSGCIDAWQMSSEYVRRVRTQTIKGTGICNRHRQIIHASEITKLQATKLCLVNWRVAQSRFLIPVYKLVLRILFSRIFPHHPYLYFRSSEFT